MASIILGGVGSAVGGPIGGVIGGTLGAFIDAKIAGRFAKKPHMLDLHVTAATFGQVIPVAYRRCKFAGNLIASTNLVPHKHSGSGKASSGKGSIGGSTTTYYTYTADFAVGICKGPVQNIWRVFADSKPIWDMHGETISGTSSQPLIQSGFTSNQWGGVATIYEYGQSNKNNHTQSAVGSITFYYGSEDQQPDAFLQSLLGITNVPAFRGLAYAVFTGLPLQYFGNRIPNLSFEVNGGYTGPSTVFTGSNLPNQANTGHAYTYNLGNNIIYDCSQLGIDTIFGGNAGLFNSLIFNNDPTAKSAGPSAPTFTSVTCGREIGPNNNLYIELAVGGANGFGILSVSSYSGSVSMTPVGQNTGSGLGAMTGSGITCFMGSLNSMFLSDATGLFQVYDTALRQTYAGIVASGNQQLWRYTLGSTTPIQLQNGSTATTFVSPTNVTWAEFRSLLVVLDGVHGIQYTLNLNGAPYISNISSLSGFNGTNYRVIYDNTNDVFIYQNSTDIYLVKDITTSTLAATFHTTAHTLNSNVSTWYSYQDFFSNQYPFGNVFVAAGPKVFNLSTVDLSPLNISGSLVSPFDWTNPPPNTVSGGTPAVAALDVPPSGSPMLFSPFQDKAIEYKSTVATGSASGWAVYNFVAPQLSLGSVVKDIIQQTGLTSNQIDTTAATDVIPGYAITSESSARHALEALQEVFLFDMPESNGKLVFRYRSAGAASPILNVNNDDLGARELVAGQFPGVNPLPKVIETRTQLLDLPHVLMLRYKTTGANAYVPDYSFEIAGTYARRTFAEVGLVNHMSISTPVVLDETTAASICRKILYFQYIGRTKLQFTLPIKYLAIEAGDVINLAYLDQQGNTVSYAVYVQQADIGADNTIKIQAVVTDVTAFSATGKGQASLMSTGSITSGQPTTLALMDLPPLQDSDDNVGLYWAMCGIGNSVGWSGSLLRSVDGGVSYASLGTQNNPSVIGFATTVLPSAPATHWDTTNSVTVKILAGSMASVTPAQVLSNQNVFLLGGEICAASLAVQNTDLTWTLSRLRRGIRSTDTASGSHSIGDRFVMLNSNGQTINFVETMGDIGVQELYIGASSNGLAATQISVPFTENGRRIMPDPVANACIAYDASNNATISWVPRRRIGFEWTDSFEAGVDEPVENYQIDIYSGSTVVRTITGWISVTGTVGSQAGVDTGRRTASYTAVQQTTDGLTPGGPITCSIYQMSTRIGRGVARTITQ